ncbi:MAG: leucine-rich repeat domain-containing protein [Lachnospiraceae bacterium]|jgi:hypothetical protein|nr:leucine-rich repeat domain-containing protein [Lachnospiraceae bacterium]
MEKSNKISVNYLYKRFHILIFAITLLIVFGFALTFSKIVVKAYEVFNPSETYHYTFYFNDGSNSEKKVGFYKDKALTQWFDVNPSESFWGFDNGDGINDSSTIIGDTGATGEPTLTFNWGFSFTTDAPVGFSLLGDGVRCENLTIKLNNDVKFNVLPTIDTLPNGREKDVEKQLIGIEAKTKDNSNDYYTTLKIKGSGSFGTRVFFQPHDDNGSLIEVPNVKCTGISTGAIINDSGNITLASDVSAYTVGVVTRGIAGDVTINNGYLQLNSKVYSSDITLEAYEVYGDSLAYGIVGDVTANGGGGRCNIGEEGRNMARGYGVSGNIFIKGGRLIFDVKGDSKKGKSFGAINGSVIVEDGSLDLLAGSSEREGVGMELSKNQYFLYKGGTARIGAYGREYGGVIYDPTNLGKMESEIDYNIYLYNKQGGLINEKVDRKIPIKQLDLKNAYSMEISPYSSETDSGKMTYDENDIRAVNSIIENNQNISWQKDEPKTWDFYEGKTNWEQNGRVLRLKKVDLSGEKLSSASIDLDGQNLNNGLSELTRLNLSNNTSLQTGSILNLNKLSTLYINNCSLTSFDLQNLAIDSQSYLKALFDGSNQEVSLLLDASSKDNFETSVTLNNPKFYLDKECINVATDISYKDGKLYSLNSKLVTIYYVAETGITDANIDGKMNLTYKVQSEEPTTVDKNDETKKPGETKVPSKAPEVTIEKITTISTSDNVSKTNGSSSQVRTGDTNNTLPWVILSLAMLVVVSTIVVKKIKH